MWSDSTMNVHWQKVCRTWCGKHRITDMVKWWCNPVFKSSITLKLHPRPLLCLCWWLRSEMCIDLLKPLTRTCRHWALCITGGLHFRYCPAILYDTSHKYIIGPWVFQGQGLILVNAFNTHIPPTPSSEHFSSVFHQQRRFELNPQHQKQRGGLSFFGFLGPTSKNQRLELCNSELESSFNYVCGSKACHQCVTPKIKPCRGLMLWIIYLKLAPFVFASKNISHTKAETCAGHKPCPIKDIIKTDKAILCMPSNLTLLLFKCRISCETIT